MATVYYEKDANRADIQDKVIWIIGLIIYLLSVDFPDKSTQLCIRSNIIKITLCQSRPCADHYSIRIYIVKCVLIKLK